MDPDALEALLRGVASGKVKVSEAIVRLRGLPFEDIGYARIDHHRHLRRGFPEVIFAEGKTPAQCAAIVDRIAVSRQPVLVTRANDEQFVAIRKTHPAAVWHEAARVITVARPERDKGGSPARKEGRPARRGVRGRRPRGQEEVLVVTAGTSDIPVAEEAAVTAETMGVSVGRIYDVGVAGLHRLLGERTRLDEAESIVVAAGMEGALPSVVAGMVETPVIGVPTSIGYGASLGGITPLLAMLTSCSSGLTVVNIDNGFGAGYAAAMIALRVRE